MGRRTRKRVPGGAPPPGAPVAAGGPAPPGRGRGGPVARAHPGPPGATSSAPGRRGRRCRSSRGRSWPGSPASSRLRPRRDAGAGSSARLRARPPSPPWSWRSARHLAGYRSHSALLAARSRWPWPPPRSCSPGVRQGGHLVLAVAVGGAALPALREVFRGAPAAGVPRVSTPDGPRRMQLTGCTTSRLICADLGPHRPRSTAKSWPDRSVQEGLARTIRDAPLLVRRPGRHARHARDLPGVPRPPRGDRRAAAPPTTWRSASRRPRSSTRGAPGWTAADVPATDVFDRGGLRSIYVRDPDGHVLEIAAASGGPAAPRRL
jgi:hypothetical protein